MAQPYRIQFARWSEPKYYISAHKSRYYRFPLFGICWPQSTHISGITGKSFCIYGRQAEIYSEGRNELSKFSNPITAPWNNGIQKKLDDLFANPPEYGECTFIAIYRGGHLVRVETLRKESSQLESTKKDIFDGA
jgi:hypothetical protein